MNDRQVSLGTVSAVTCWLATWLLLTIGTVVGLAGDGERIFAGEVLLAHGLAMSAVAATVTVRAMLRNHGRLMQDAFSLGREAGSVRRLSR